MGKVLLSFLGTSRYLAYNYYFRENRVENVKFVQLAMVKLFCSDFSANDRIVLFLTERARRENWNDTDEGPGLKSCLEDLNLPSTLIPIDIPDGDSEESLWRIFDFIYNSVEPNDEVVLDVTHGLRSLPMLNIVLLNYARFLKGINVRGIYYGALETIGTKDLLGKKNISDRNAPIFDLTPFETLQRWSIAADNFINHGDTIPMCKLIHNSVDPLLRKTKGGDRQARNERNFAEALNSFSLSISTVRGKDIVEGAIADRLIESIDQISNSHLHTSPLKPILDTVREKVSAFKQNSIENGFAAVIWCIKSGLVQQGITLLQETIITYLLQKGELGWTLKKNRELLSSYIHVLQEKKNKSQWDERLRENEKLFDAVFSLQIFPLLSTCYETLREFRNDINHGGFVNPKKAKDFNTKLRSVTGKVQAALIKGG